MKQLHYLTKWSVISAIRMFHSTGNKLQHVSAHHNIIYFVQQQCLCYDRRFIHFFLVYVSKWDAWTKETITKVTRFKITLKEACVRSDVNVRGCPVRKISVCTPNNPTDIFMGGFFLLPPNKRRNNFLQYTTTVPSHALSNSLFILLNHSTLQSLSNDRVYKLRTHTQTHLLKLRGLHSLRHKLWYPCCTYGSTSAQEQTVVTAGPGILKARQVPWTKPKWPPTLKFASMRFKSDDWKAFHNKHTLTQM